MAYITKITLPDSSVYDIKDASAINPNLLINPDFAVNQRGQTEYSGAVFTADRWQAVSVGTKVDLTDGYKVGFTSGSSSQTAAIAQYIEASDAVKGAALTLTLNVRETTSARMYMEFGYLDASSAYKNVASKFITTGAGVYSITGSLPEDCPDRLYVRIYGADKRAGDTNSSYSVFGWAKLEPGSAATPFCPPDPATELAKCQRYYQIRSTGDIAAVDMRPTMRTITDIKQRSDGNYEYIAEL